MNWQLHGIPYTSMEAPGGIAKAIDALRDCGLAERLGEVGVDDGGDLILQQPTGRRGAAGVLNEPALTHLVEETCRCVLESHRRGHLPLMVGGDCPVLLGPLAAIRAAGFRPGLIMIDGHEDAWPPNRSPTGEASDSEVAIALGRVPDLPRPLADRLPFVAPSGLAYLGPRDAAEIADGGIDSLRAQAAFFASDSDLREGHEEVAEMMRQAVQAVETDGFWLHIDLDVLSTTEFSAVDYRQPGGLSWGQLEQLALAALSDARLRGASVVIYNPDLDPSRQEAKKVVNFLARVIDRR